MLEIDELADFPSDDATIKKLSDADLRKATIESLGHALTTGDTGPADKLFGASVQRYRERVDQCLKENASWIEGMNVDPGSSRA